MRKNVLNFCKLIISKVAFDKNLLIKEINKAAKILSSTELAFLQVWCYREYGNDLKKELDLIFIPVK